MRGVDEVEVVDVGEGVEFELEVEEVVGREGDLRVEEAAEEEEDSG